MTENDYQALIAGRVRHMANAGGIMKLREPGQDTYSVSVPMPHFAMCLEMGHTRGKDIALPFLNEGTSGVTSKCDRIIFIPRDGKPPLALLIELKTMNQAGADHQVRCSAAFAKYLHTLAKENGRGNGQVECRGLVVWYRKTPAKLPTGGVPFTFVDHGGTLICELDRAFSPFPVASLLHAIDSGA